MISKKMQGMMCLGFLMLGILGSPLGDAEASIEIKNAWVRPASAGHNTALYCDIQGGDDALIGASCEACEIVELHDHVKEKRKGSDNATVEVNVMRAISRVPLNSQGVTSLKRGGLHIMLLNLKKDLKEGDSIVCTLNFEHTPSVRIRAPVQFQK